MDGPALPSAAQWTRWGIDPAWSRVVEVPNGSETHAWHVLDTGPALPDAKAPVATIVCVHGNPTWSFLWRSFLAQLGDRYRVIAIDQLGMGYSDRTDRRRFAQRVDDLGRVIDALQIDGPIITVAHDWGGPISLGWVLRNRDRVEGVVLCNTGVAVPAGRRAPAIIRVAAAGPITDFVGHRTRAFVAGTPRLSGKRVGKIAREGLGAPYGSARFRRAVAEFVDDVPFSPTDPSAALIAEVAEGIRSLTMPVLLVWGSKDPVFNDDFALDLAERMPHADLHRFAGLGHLVVEETDVAGLVDGWLAERVAGAARVDPPPAASSAVAVAPIWAGLAGRADDPAAAFVDGATGETTSFAQLHARVMGIAAGLSGHGLAPGDRVAVLVPPGIDLLATVYGCWRAGAVTVVADRGLGLGGLGAAVRGAHVQWVIGPPRAIAAARALRWATGASFIATGKRAVPGARVRLDHLALSRADLPAEPSPSDFAAVLYTSGATGPAKGVRYRHGQMTAQRDALASVYSITESDRLVAAFAPFALYGPALGITSTIPDVDVTKPGSLTAEALGDAVRAIKATIVFASPAALANVNRTAAAAEPDLASLRLVLSAGAPVPIATLRATAALCPAAELHTPYGMTECLPVADIELSQRERANVEHPGGGVCVGMPVPGVEVMVAANSDVLVRAPWLSDGYDQLWLTQHDARPRDSQRMVWHRTGDVGRLDPEGRLWIEGRNVHVIHTVAGPVTPVPVEVAVERLEGVERVAVVGVGPVGCQQVVVVVEVAGCDDGLADRPLTDAVRGTAQCPIAAVLVVGDLPVDIRHNTKIDRTAVSGWATAVLNGDRAKRSW